MLEPGEYYVSIKIADEGSAHNSQKVPFRLTCDREYTRALTSENHLPGVLGRG
jgi:hypothetical protein